MLTRTNERKINISVTLDPDLLRGMERLAHKEGVTVSALLRDILRAEMERRHLARGKRPGMRRKIS